MNEIMSLMNRDISGWMCSGDDEAVTAIVFKKLLYKAAIDEQHISFQNASHEMQQSWNDTANQADQTVDSSQNAGMTDEQIDIANDLCGAEDDVDDRLGSGWEHTDFDTSFLDAGITESEAPASAEVSSGESEGASEGVGEDNSGEGGSGGEDDGLGE